MNYSTILEHAFEVTARHRALWVLGFLWALVGGCGAGGGGGSSSFPFGGGGDRDASIEGEVPEALRRLGDQLGRIAPEQWLAVAIGAACIGLALLVATTIARYVLQAGVLRSLDQLDAEGIEPTVRAGWREGWHRRTWRPFLQNLGVDFVLLLGFFAAALPILLPLVLLLAAADGDMGAASLLGLLGMCSYCCLWILLVIVVSNAVEVLKQLWWRYALLDDHDFLSAIGLGWRLGRQNVRPLFGMWLVMVLVGLLWLLVSMGLVVAFALVAALVAGGPAWLLYRATEGLAWPLVWGIPAGILAFVVPLVFAGGLYLVFQASVWTQVFRQLAGGPCAPPALPKPPELSQPA